MRQYSMQPLLPLLQPLWNVAVIEAVPVARAGTSRSGSWRRLRRNWRLRQSSISTSSSSSRSKAKVVAIVSKSSKGLLIWLTHKAWT